MKVLVTGTTGFVGGNLVRELLADRYEVRALVRKESDRRNLEGLDVEVAYGDLRDAGSLDRAVDGCDGVFHVAAAYTLWARDPKPIYETNVGGTQRLLAVAVAHGVKKVVYTSTESTIGINVNGSGEGEGPARAASSSEPTHSTLNRCRLGTEDAFEEIDHVAGHYKRSKLMAEQLALRMWREEGVPVVVVNPTTPIGPGDVKPTPTGRIVVDFLNRRMPAYVDTGLNLVSVVDVARGHVLAMEKGRVGERYLLGNRNLTLREVFGLLEGITGLPAPKLKLPLWVAQGAAYLCEGFAALSGKPPRVPLAGVKTARKVRYFDCSKAVRELGLPQSPIEDALERAVRWFRDNGYAD